MRKVVAPTAAYACPPASQDLDQNVLLHVKIEYKVNAQVLSQGFGLGQGPWNPVKYECFVAAVVGPTGHAHDLDCQIVIY